MATKAAYQSGRGQLSTIVLPSLTSWTTASSPLISCNNLSPPRPPGRAGHPLRPRQSPSETPRASRSFYQGQPHRFRRRAGHAAERALDALGKLIGKRGEDHRCDQPKDKAAPRPASRVMPRNRKFPCAAATCPPVPMEMRLFLYPSSVHFLHPFSGKGSIVPKLRVVALDQLQRLALCLRVRQI